MLDSRIIDQTGLADKTTKFGSHPRKTNTYTSYKMLSYRHECCIRK